MLVETRAIWSHRGRIRAIQPAVAAIRIMASTSLNGLHRGMAVGNLLCIRSRLSSTRGAGVRAAYSSPLPLLRLVGDSLVDHEISMLALLHRKSGRTIVTWGGDAEPERIPIQLIDALVIPAV